MSRKPPLGQVVPSTSQHTLPGRTGRTGSTGGLEEQKWNSRAEEGDAGLALHHFHACRQGEAEMCTPVRVAALRSTLKIGKLRGVCLQKTAGMEALGKDGLTRFCFGGRIRIETRSHSVAQAGLEHIIILLLQCLKSRITPVSQHIQLVSLYNSQVSGLVVHVCNLSYVAIPCLKHIGWRCNSVAQ